MIRNVLMHTCYVYISVCSIWTAAIVVSLDVNSATTFFVVVAYLASLVMMHAEFMLMKALVMDLTAGERVILEGIHEHPLYWSNMEGKGYTVCSSCNEKLGMKTGGFLALQCRKCEPGRYGFGGFQICMRCYRKQSLKAGESGAASGVGILRGDRGPKVAQKLTVVQYMVRLMRMIPRATFGALLFVVCGSQVLNTYIPKAQGDCITALVHGKEEDFDEKVMVFGLLVVISAVMGYAMTVAVQTLQTRLYCHMSISLFSALINQDIAFYDNAMTGQLNSRLNNDLRQAVSPVSIIINSFLANIVVLLAGFFVCFQASWKLTVLAFSILAPMMHITTEFSKWASGLLATQYTYLADAQGSATQALTNIRTVHAFSAQGVEQGNFELHTKKSMAVGLRSAWGMGGADLLSGLVQQAAAFIVLYYGGHLALGHNGPDVGTIITFTYLWGNLSGAFKSLNNNLNQPVKAMSAGQRVFEILDLQPDISTREPNANQEELENIEVKLDGVDFTYQSRPDKKILQSATLTLPTGKTTAVVGKSGCGKSTIAKLLLRFYDPQNGRILLNGTDLKQMDLQSLRTRIGIVSQDTQLFRLSISENITYGMRPGSFSEEDVERAAVLANADEFIRTLPEGYKTVVGEGGHDLSGGQKQRLSIARALVRKPRLLLLDEATSALDAENEAQVQQSLDTLVTEMQGSCTILVIAHRLSTIRDASNIVVLHEGLVVEQGIHDELVQIKDGRYATMIARQLTNSGDAEAGEEEDGEPSDDVVAKRTQSELIRLVEALPDAKKAEVLMAVMMKFKGSMMKGKGKG